MITLRPSQERGHAEHGWLDAYHTFSFADYHDPAHMGFRSLRVINEDRIMPGMGFGTHPHRDMEILTYILEGRLAHQDSMGNGREIGPGQLQAMSAGTGILHSEFNASRTEPVHLLQIWIRPANRGITPRYAEWNPPAGDSQPFTLLASRDGRENSAVIDQDAAVYLLKLEAGSSLDHPVAPGRGVWVQVMRGNLVLEAGTAAERLGPGDGAAVEDESRLVFTAESPVEALVFDLA